MNKNFPKLCRNSCDGAYDSLDVRFTKACDNNCAFCIERGGAESLGATQVEKMIEATIKTEIQDVLILGGEPFLFPELLYQYVKGIRLFVHKIYITTSLPDTINTERETCKYIIRLIDGLNISVYSVDPIENNNIYQASSKHDRLAILKRLNQNYGFREDIRVSITLVKGGIDSREKLEDALCKLAILGCKNIKIAELQNTPDLYVSYEKIMGVKLPPPFACGCNTALPGKHGMKITLKRSCFMVEPSLKACLRDCFKMALRPKKKNRFAVVYENGSVSPFWVRQPKNDCLKSGSKN